MLLKKVRQTINEHNLLEYGDTVLCAVSGGADSICLLHIMQSLKSEYNLNVCVANVNHLLRGEEADRDSNFVKSVCKAADVKCFYREYDVKQIAKDRKLGEEECGRICRYEFFGEIAQQLGNAKIATAHNLNDNAETVIFRLARGSASNGLSGIKYRRENIIRPLLDVSRDEIEKYLRQNGISWCEDSTNKLSVYTRNKIRNLVTPLLNEISNNATNHIVTTANLISKDEEYLSELASKAISECFFDDYILIDKLSDKPDAIKRRIIAAILKSWNTQEVNYKKIIDFSGFLTKESGKQFDINSDYYAEKSYNKIVLKKRLAEKKDSFLLKEGAVLKDKNWEIVAEISDVLPQKNGNNTAVFDAEKLDFPLTVRYRNAGDRMIVKGMNGSKKLNDIFSDEKIERYTRDLIPVIEKNGEILFLCGLRQSGLYNISDETQKYLVIKYTKER